MNTTMLNLNNIVSIWDCFQKKKPIQNDQIHFMTLISSVVFQLERIGVQVENYDSLKLNSKEAFPCLSSAPGKKVKKRIVPQTVAKVQANPAFVNPNDIITIQTTPTKQDIRMRELMTIRPKKVWNSVVQHSGTLKENAALMVMRQYLIPLLKWLLIENRHVPCLFKVLMAMVDYISVMALYSKNVNFTSDKSRLILPWLCVVLEVIHSCLYLIMYIIPEKAVKVYRVINMQILAIRKVMRTANASEELVCISKGCDVCVQKLEKLIQSTGSIAKIGVDLKFGECSVYKEIGLELSIAFKEEVDSKHLFTSSELVHLYSNRERIKDEFLAMLKLFYGLGDKNLFSTYAERVLALQTGVDRIKKLIITLNLKWFAEFFVDEMLVVSLCSLTEQLDMDHLAKQWKENPEKIQKLHRRLTDSGKQSKSVKHRVNVTQKSVKAVNKGNFILSNSEEPWKPVFDGTNYEFFYLLLRTWDSYQFGKILLDVISFKMDTIRSIYCSKDSLEKSPHQIYEHTNHLKVLTVFLSFLNLSPGCSLACLSSNIVDGKISNNAIEHAKQHQLAITLNQKPIFYEKMINYLTQAILEKHVVLVLPAVCEFLKLQTIMNPSALNIPASTELWKLVVAVYQQNTSAALEFENDGFSLQRLTSSYICTQVEWLVSETKMFDHFFVWGYGNSLQDKSSSKLISTTGNVIDDQPRHLLHPQLLRMCNPTMDKYLTRLATNHDFETAKSKDTKASERKVKNRISTDVLCERSSNVKLSNVAPKPSAHEQLIRAFFKKHAQLEDTYRVVLERVLRNGFANASSRLIHKHRIRLDLSPPVVESAIFKAWNALQRDITTHQAKYLDDCKLYLEEYTSEKLLEVSNTLFVSDEIQVEVTQEFLRLSRKYIYEQIESRLHLLERRYIEHCRCSIKIFKKYVHRHGTTVFKELGQSIHNFEKKPFTLRYTDANSNNDTKPVARQLLATCFDDDFDVIEKPTLQAILYFNDQIVNILQSESSRSDQVLKFCYDTFIQVSQVIASTSIHWQYFSSHALRNMFQIIMFLANRSTSNKDWCAWILFCIQEASKYELSITISGDANVSLLEANLLSQLALVTAEGRVLYGRLLHTVTNSGQTLAPENLFRKVLLLCKLEKGQAWVFYDMLQGYLLDVELPISPILESLVCYVSTIQQQNISNNMNCNKFTLHQLC